MKSTSTAELLAGRAASGLRSGVKRDATEAASEAVMAPPAVLAETPGLSESLSMICFGLAAQLLRDARGRRTIVELTAAAHAFHDFVATDRVFAPREKLDALRTGVDFSCRALMTVAEVIAVAEAQLEFVDDCDEAAVTGSRDGAVAAEGALS